MTDTSTETKPKTPTLKASTLVPAEQARREWVVRLAPGITFDDVLEPGFWRTVASTLHPGDRIEVQADEWAFVADLIVADVGRTWARVLVLRYAPQLGLLTEEDPDAWKSEYRIEQRAAGYTIFHIGDNALHGAHPTYDAAVLRARELHRR